jgi:hypothetical protein
MLETFDLSSLSKKQKKKLTYQTRTAINSSDSTTPISTHLPHELQSKVTELINKTRIQIANSVLYKSGKTVDYGDCFIPSRKTLHADHRLFAILPMRKYGMPFVDIVFRSINSLWNHSVKNKDDKITRPAKQGIHRIREECRIFHHIFDFRQLGLQSR